MDVESEKQAKETNYKDMIFQKQKPKTTPKVEEPKKTLKVEEPKKTPMSDNEVDEEGEALFGGKAVRPRHLQGLTDSDDESSDFQ